MINFIRFLVRILPGHAAARMLALIASITSRPQLKPRDEAALARARTLKWGPEGRHQAYAWGEDGDPLVILIHGWGGRASQMAPIAELLCWLGFQALAPDISAHGQSPGRLVSFRKFISDIAAFTQHLKQPTHALIGHSAGGLTMMAARLEYGIEAENYVLINAPKAPYPPVEIIRRKVMPPQRVITLLRQNYAEQFGHNTANLNNVAAHRYCGQGRLLVVADQDDTQVNPEDAKTICSGWPGSIKIKTRGLGHQAVLYDESLLIKIGDFLTGSGKAIVKPQAA